MQHTVGSLYVSCLFCFPKRHAPIRSSEAADCSETLNESSAAQRRNSIRLHYLTIHKLRWPEEKNLTVRTRDSLNLFVLGRPDVQDMYMSKRDVQNASRCERSFLIFKNESQLKAQTMQLKESNFNLVFILSFCLFWPSKKVFFLKTENIPALI